MCIKVYYLYVNNFCCDPQRINQPIQNIFYESCYKWILFLEDNENWAFVSRLLIRDSVGRDPRII